MSSPKKTPQNKLQKKHFPKSAKTSHVGMHFQQKTLPQKPMKQATMHTGRRAQTTHTSQRDVFTAYLPSLHLSNHNHTHHKPYHTPTHTQHPSTHTTIYNHHHPQPLYHNNHPHIHIHNDYILHKTQRPTLQPTQTSTATLLPSKPTLLHKSHSQA